MGFYPQVVIVTGMHRSGTSLTASLLQSLGVDIGSSLMPADVGNEKGHFEDLDFVNLHRNILHSNGIESAGWTTDQFSVPCQFYYEAQRLLLSRNKKPLWGWKDPRTTLFLDFWFELIPSVKFIFVFRSPWQVIDSIFRRSVYEDSTFFKNPTHALRVWHYYNEKIIDFYQTHPHQCVLLNVKNIISMFDDVLDKLESKLNIVFAQNKFEKLYDAQSIELFDMSNHREMLINKYFPKAINLYHKLNELADLAVVDDMDAARIYADNESIFKDYVFQDWLDSHKVKRETKEKLYEVQGKLYEVQGKLYEVQGKLYDSQVRLISGEEQLNDSNRIINKMRRMYFWKLKKSWAKVKLKMGFSVDRSYYGFNVPEQDGINNTKNKIKESLTQSYLSELESFLVSKRSLIFEGSSRPTVSIIIVLYNRVELTFQCLLSILASKLCANSYEVVIVDNKSSDKTPLLMEQIEGVKIIKNDNNIHFLLAANQASKVAKGEYLLFLNSDAQVFPDAIGSALNTIKKDPAIGVVGGKIILLDGKLQEAGSIIWRDGSCKGYGRGDDPCHSSYMFEREVDYCSGAFLLTPRKLFIDNNRFDESFKPAYYEEVDYCFRLKQQGYKIIYSPDAVIKHYEFASSNSKSEAVELQKSNRAIFIKKHHDLLQKQFENSKSNNLMARYANQVDKHILFIDDRVPHQYLGAGYPRANAILKCLVEMKKTVTFFPMKGCDENWETIYEDIPKEVEVIKSGHKSNLSSFLKGRKSLYDSIIISRPHNMKKFNRIFNKNMRWLEDINIVYDAEAIYAYRKMQLRRLQGNELSDKVFSKLVEKEVLLAKKSNSIMVVSQQEENAFKKYKEKRTHVLSNVAAINPPKNTLEDREGILFVGAIHGSDSPNYDSVYWFVNEILPMIHQQANTPIRFTVAGFNNSRKIKSLESDVVEIVGKVSCLQNLYESSRLFVAPTRFAAGIPLKAYHAASHGLPMVTTSLIASQINWKNDREVLIADDALSFAKQCIRLYYDSELWNSLSMASMKKTEHDCSKEKFMQSLHAAIE
jgi:GT2 family glycosyltransferase